LSLPLAARPSLRVSSRLSPWRTAGSPSVSAEDPQRTSRPWRSCRRAPDRGWPAGQAPV